MFLNGSAKFAKGGHIDFMFLTPMPFFGKILVSLTQVFSELLFGSQHSGRSRISQRGCANVLNWQQFYQKLHESKNDSTEMGRASLALHSPQIRQCLNTKSK